MTRLLALLIALATVAGSATGHPCPPRCAPDPCHGAGAPSAATVEGLVSVACPPAGDATAVLPGDEQGRRAPVAAAAPAHGLRQADAVPQPRLGRPMAAVRGLPPISAPFPLRI